MSMMDDLSTISYSGAKLQSLYLFSAKNGGKVYHIDGIKHKKCTISIGAS
jgi:hypothetical protein